ncbi:MAG: Uncharacterised protein [Cellulomonadaceae bacterium TMED98]|nr:MAG: Uncharacterised protein [Cellulomonadaceae bacterium TMED98]
MAGFCFPHRHGFGVSVDRGGFGANVHVDVEAVFQRARGLKHQRRAVWDHPAHVIGQSAVGKRDFPASLQHRDLGAFA